MPSESTRLLNRSNAVSPNDHHLSISTVSMLAIGGTIGTGLFFSVATLIARGPLMAIASMCYIAFIVVIVLEVTAELAVFFPEASSICKFQFVFLGRPIGLANSVIYWLSWGFTYALELSIAVSIFSFWCPKLTENYQSLSIFACWLILTTFNLFPVDVYGQIEFWISLVKVVAIIGWIAVIAISLVSKDEFFYVWLQDWPESFVGPSGSWTKHVVAFVNCLIFSSFIFQSVESIAITTGDITQPHKTIPKVTKIIFLRIVVFYLVSVLLLTLSVPFSDPELTNPQVDDLLSSPFLIAMINCGFESSGVLLSCFNFVILSAIISAANSNVYFGSRFLVAMIQTHGADTRWSVLSYKNAQNVPTYAILLTSSLGLVPLLLRFHSISILFTVLLTCCASAGMSMWLLLCVSHIRFSQALKAQGRTRRSLRYCSKWKLEYWAWFASANLILILLLNGFSNYWSFSWLAVLGSYMTPLAFFGLWLWFGGYRDFSMKPVTDIDLDGGNFRYR
ncbi:hypothetical protein OXX69_003069 [Metschnikowia pulcherrima]